MSETAKGKILPPDVTSYDILKTAAVLLMIVDHIGYYFYSDPEILWFRAAGRICVPIWFFLIGYSASQRIPAIFAIGAVILIAANFVTGLAILPLNVLFTMIAARLLVGPLMEAVFRKRTLIWSLTALLFVLIVPTYSLTEYGTQGLMLAIFGYMMRHRESMPDQRIITQYAVFNLVLFIAIQQILFGFSQPQLVFMAAGVLATGVWLYNFKPETLPRLTGRLGPGATLLKFTGRRTLEIYVAHLVLFKFISLYLGDERFQWFRWMWMG